MKSLIKISVILFSVLLIVPEVCAQSFYTGSIGVNLNNFGRVRIFSDNLTTRQIDRSSILVGVSSSAVFDYTQDAGTVTASTTVASPVQSDFEVTGTINNSDSNLPPNVEVKINIYGWNSQAYALVKMNVKNDETTSIDAVIGIEVIPQIDNAYGNETVQYNAGSQTVLVNKTAWVGYKFFSAPQTSLKSINWTSGYGTDALFYQWLTQNSFDPSFTAGVDGAVAIMGQAPVSIQPGQSVDFYFGVALGTDQASCINNMNACEVKYYQIVPVELTSFTATSANGTVDLRWSTATEVNNRGFEIQRMVGTTDGQWTTIGFREGKGTTTEPQQYQFTDNAEGLNGIVSYRLKQVDYNGTYAYSDVVEVDFAPVSFILEQNYPNPFNPSTKIRFAIPESQFVTLRVFSVLGEEVTTLVSELLDAGIHEAEFKASGVSSGMYFYTLTAGDYSSTKKMILTK